MLFEEWDGNPQQCLTKMMKSMRRRSQAFVTSMIKSKKQHQTIQPQNNVWSSQLRFGHSACVRILRAAPARRR
ncbi:hypothetical protein ILYODFUR_005546 [Ilyodon furcidens]|uniref:Uncharacterized protein n=1 Tax=Ilyodon furcidens TaxID=33524 RepID=A0ABV0U490_9TELE